MPTKSFIRCETNNGFRLQSITSNMTDSTTVRVNVYDMSWLNEYIGNIGLGVFHTGIEVHSREYCYGGHQFGGSGIFEMVPKDSAYLGSNYLFKTSIELGTTDFTYNDVCMILNGMETDFCGDQYHLLRKNCNHFSQAFVEILCGASLPKWVNRLAVVSTKLPFIERSIPKEWLTPLQPSDEDDGVIEFDNVEHTNVQPIAALSSQLSLSNGSARVRRETDIDNYRPTSLSGNTTKSPSEQWRRFSAQVQQYFQRPSSTGSSTRSSSRVAHRSNNNIEAVSSSSNLSISSSTSSSVVVGKRECEKNSSPSHSTATTTHRKP